MAELKTFLFTDICGSVRLKGEMTGRSVTERDLAFIESILTPHRGRIEGRLGEFGGRVVSTAGDGHFLVFENTVQAAQWAVSVQESHRDDPIKTPAGDKVDVRVSMHVGVPQIDPGDPNNFVGKSVDYAARLNDYATGGQILVSRSVMAILDDVGLEGIRLRSHGKKNLKGIGNVEVHELLYDDSGPKPLRSAPKSSFERQWTVLPTVGYEGGAGTATATSTALQRVGNYELEELLGSGGMGDVYKARHTQFGRVRAVKVIKPQFVASGQSEVIRRFYNEIKAVGRLEHKNIVVAIDSSSPADRVHYLVMEYIDGVGVDELVAQRGSLEIPEACEIIRQAARGLQYIHKNDMVHRDIKPSNLMVTVIENEQAVPDSTFTHASEGERAVVKILDLGLALLAEDGHDRLTRLEHKAMGTGMYMSPEQWKTTSVDIRADIYSLGCTLYHLLAGNPPFYDSDLRPEKAHEKSAAPPIRVGAQALPKKLWDVLKRMLEKRPEDRYATPAEVSAALAPFCEGQQLAALVREHIGGTGKPKAEETVAVSKSKGDTWRSKSKPGDGRLAESMQWAGHQAPKLLLLAAAIAGALWFFYASKQAYLAERLKEAQEQLPAFARAAASDEGKLAKNVALRFEKLTQLAEDPKLVEALGEHNRRPEDSAPLTAMDQWIGGLTHTTGVNVESWFIDDAVGKQVARSPRGDTVGGDYRKRDYFHGLGRDLTDPAEIARAKPISKPHLSAVYRSDETKKLKVAFSVPIWGEVELSGERQPGAPGESTGSTPKEDELDSIAAAPARQRAVIGVLGMSVNVSDFEVLEGELARVNQIVLIDLRPDQIDGKEKTGLILHHPNQDKGVKTRVDKDVLAQIVEASPLDPDFHSEDHFLTGYHDPFDPSHLYWGAFQPVAFKIGNAKGDAAESAERPEWIVLVQKPMP